MPDGPAFRAKGRGFTATLWYAESVAPPLFSWDMSRTDEIVDTTPTRALPFRMLW